MPNSIKNAPILGFGLGFYYFAFKNLNTCRSFGMGPGPISWIDIKKYADAYGLNLQEFEELLYVINKIDQDFLSWQNTKA